MQHRGITFKITEAATQAGVSPSTLRLWESQGLIDPIRTPSGQRIYDAALVERVRRISWLRNERGLNPAAIRDVLRQEETGEQLGEDADPVDVPVGLKIRRLRQEQRKTLENVGQATDLPVSTLSTFERTSVGLSFPALHKVASYLGTTVTSLSGQAKVEPESLVRNGDWKSWPLTSSGVSVQMLADGDRQMECNRFQLAPGASSEEAYQHEGEEFIFVLQGSLEIVLDGDQFFQLNMGDSFYFESARSHYWRNSSAGETILIWINTPPTF